MVKLTNTTSCELHGVLGFNLFSFFLFKSQRIYTGRTGKYSPLNVATSSSVQFCRETDGSTAVRSNFQKWNAITFGI